MLNFLTILSVLVLLANSTKLPDYITPCKSNDPLINECATINANKALPNIVKGDKEFRIPNMIPLKLTKVNINPSENFKLLLNNVTVSGLETGNVLMNINEKDRIWTTTVSFDELDIKAQYKISGQIMVLPITGNGDAEIKFDSPIFTSVIVFEVTTKNSEEYYRIKTSKVTHDLKGVHYHLHNLFNGDKRLGDEMNKFMNENWQQLDQDIGPTLDEIVKSITQATITVFMNRIPYKELFTF